MHVPDENLISRLREARDIEHALARQLGEHIAIAPGGSFRSELERHLGETRRHAERVEARLAELEFGRTLTEIGTALFDEPPPESEQALAAAERHPAERAVFENAKDACVAESREIAVYIAIEERAREVGDETTERLAASIRSEEERMLDLLLDRIPSLARASSESVGARV